MKSSPQESNVGPIIELVIH